MQDDPNLELHYLIFYSACYVFLTAFQSFSAVPLVISFGDVWMVDTFYLFAIQSTASESGSPSLPW